MRTLKFGNHFPGFYKVSLPGLALLVGMLGAFWLCNGPTPAFSATRAGQPKTLASLVVVSGDNQHLYKNTDGAALQVKTLGLANEPLAGITVTFQANPGTDPQYVPIPQGNFGGQFSLTATTDANGVATTALPLNAGPFGGVWSVTVSAPIDQSTNATTTFTEVTVGEPKSLSCVSGANQSALPNNNFAAPVVARVVDRYNNARAGVSVTLTANTSTGNANGIFLPANMTSTVLYSDYNGYITATVKANANSGTFQVTARASGGGVNPDPSCIFDSETIQSNSSNVPFYAWGANDFGQLGNGSTTQSNIPVVVNLPAGVTPSAIAAGYSHSLAIGSDGKLYAWGYNVYGELGNGSTNDSSIPVVVKLPTGVSPTAIAAGYYHNLAIGSDGKLYAWGYNASGQLGNGTTSDNNSNPTPVVVNLPAGVTPSAIAAGLFHSLAIGSDGKLYAWGYNASGQLGNGTTNNSSTPVVVNLPAGVTPTAIAVGYSHSLAIGSDGKLYVWGANEYGLLGNTSTDYSATPVVVSLPAGVTPSAIAAGEFHSLAVGSDGKLYAWGANQYGQLGNGTTSDNSNPTPVVVNLPAGVTPSAIAAGLAYNLAIGSDSKLYAWGYNWNGELGNGSITYITTPPTVVSLPAGATPLLMAAGGFHSLALTTPPPQIGVSSGSHQRTTVSTAFAAPLVAFVRDGTTNNPLAGVSVTFTAPRNGSSGTFAGGSAVYTGTTDASGLVTTTNFTANTIAGNYNVTTTVGGVATSATFGLTNLAGPVASIVAVSGDSQSATVNTAFSSPLVVSVTDQYGNPISGTTVTFTTPPSGASAAFAGGVTTTLTGVSGQATSPALTANSIAGSYSVTASVQGQSVIVSTNFTLTDVAGAASGLAIVSGDNQQTVISTTFGSPLVAKVTDGSGNVVSGVGVVFSAPATGASASFGGNLVYTGTTDGEGLVTSTIPTANSTAGSYSVSAAIVPGTYPARALRGGAGPRVTSVQYHLTNLAGAPATISVVSGSGQSTVVNTTFASPLVAKVTDSGANPVSGTPVTFTAPTSGPSGSFAGGSAVYTGTTDGSGLVTTTTFTANTLAGSYGMTATVGGVATPAIFNLTNLAGCNPLVVTSNQDDGSCGTLRAAITFASSSPTKTVSINLTAGSVISLTSGLTLTGGVSITTTAQCGIGPSNTMLPPVTILGVGPNSGPGLTLAGHNSLYGLWVRGFSDVQIKAPPGSSTKMQCVRASAL